MLAWRKTGTILFCCAFAVLGSPTWSASAEQTWVLANCDDTGVVLRDFGASYPPIPTTAAHPADPFSDPGEPYDSEGWGAIAIAPFDASSESEACAAFTALYPQRINVPIYNWEGRADTEATPAGRYVLALMYDPSASQAVKDQAAAFLPTMHADWLSLASSAPEPTPTVSPTTAPVASTVSLDEEQFSLLGGGLVLVMFLLSAVLGAQLRRP